MKAAPDSGDTPVGSCEVKSHHGGTLMVDAFSPAADPTAGATAGIGWPSARTAARALYAAAVTMAASMVAISLFFAGAGAFWGPVNDLLVVATVLLLLPAMAVLPRLARPVAGRWFGAISLAAAAGVMVIASGQLALVAGLITLDTSFVSGGLGILPVIVWIGATVVPSLRVPALGRATAVWAVALLALVGLTVVVLLALTTDTPTLSGVLGVPIMIALLGWLISLGRGLARAQAGRGRGGRPDRGV